MLRFAGHELGNLDAFRIEQIEAPTPRPNEVRIKVGAVALGFVDALIMRGLYQVKPPVPFVPGGEIVGTIEQCGSEVEGWQLGDRVATWQFGGGLAHFMTCPANELVSVPKSIGDADAAALILDYLTAYYGLFDRGDLQPGHTILVFGAAGGVGSAATRLAVISGARVLAACAAEKSGFVLNLGAEHVLDSRDDGWRLELKGRFAGGVDRVFDPVGSDAFELAFRSLAKRGRYLVVGFAAGEGIPKLPVHLALLKSAELCGVDARYLAETDRPRVKRIMRRIFKMAEDGLVQPKLACEFDLEQSIDAFRCLADRSRIGKCVVRPNAGTS